MLTYYAMLKNKRDHMKFEELYYTYRSSMYQIAIGIINDPAKAEDALQEAFTRIAKHFYELDFSDETRLKGYMATVIRSCAIDIYRRNAKEELPFEEIELSVNEAAQEKSPERIVCDEDAYQRLTEQIKNLPRLYAGILSMYYLHRMKIPDIANILGLSESAVRSQIERGRTYLLKTLQREEAKDEQRINGQPAG